MQVHFINRQPFNQTHCKPMLFNSRVLDWDREIKNVCLTLIDGLHMWICYSGFMLLGSRFSVESFVWRFQGFRADEYEADVQKPTSQCLSHYKTCVWRLVGNAAIIMSYLQNWFPCVCTVLSFNLIWCSFVWCSYSIHRSCFSPSSKCQTFCPLQLFHSFSSQSFSWIGTK